MEEYLLIEKYAQLQSLILEVTLDQYGSLLIPIILSKFPRHLEY